MSTPRPPKPSFAKLALDGVIDLFVGLFLQIGRAFALLFRMGSRSRARRAASAAAIRLGERMADTEMGNPLLVRAAVGAGKKERPAAMEQLGRSGLEVGVPPLGLEREYAAGRTARDEAEEVERSHSKLVTSLWPASIFGWVTLGINYVAVVFGLLLLWAWVAPGSAPGFAVAWITKPTPPAVVVALPSGRIEGVEVRVTKAVIGRQQVRGVGDDKMVKVIGDDLLLTVTVTLTNTGKDPLGYRTWRGEFNSRKDDAARMIDNNGYQVSRIVFKYDAVPEGGVKDAPLLPGQTVTDILVFAPPDPKFLSLDLFLPSENVGKVVPPARLTLPAEAVDKP